MKTEMEIRDRLMILEKKQKEGGFGILKATKRAQRLLQIQVLKWVLDID